MSYAPNMLYKLEYHCNIVELFKALLWLATASPLAGRLSDKSCEVRCPLTQSALSIWRGGGLGDVRGEEAAARRQHDGEPCFRRDRRRAPAEYDCPAGRQQQHQTDGEVGTP